MVLELLKGDQTLSQITAKYGAHGTQICHWKKQAIAGLVDVFSSKRKRQASSQNELVDELYKQIGQLKVELDWLKKKSDLFSK
jgi:putative transposase